MAKRGPQPDTTDERLLFELMLIKGPAAFASEVEERVPLSRQRVTKRLDNLEEDGYVVSKRASGRRLWWITEAGKDYASELVREEIS
jgi:Mn-dependent DtxR family transcriptional regulator